MTRYALIGSLALLCAALGRIFWQADKVSDLTAENKRLSASVSVLSEAHDQAVAAQAAAVELAEVQRRRAVAFQLVKENVLAKQYGGCADAAIDPDLLRDLGGVRLAPTQN